MNKLYVILGLLYLKSYKQFEVYIIKMVNNYQEEIGLLLGKIKLLIIVGFLFSKIICVFDFGYSLVISSDSQLLDNNNEDQVMVLIMVLGNLIENVLEVLSQEFGGEISVLLYYCYGWLYCEVSDDGLGIEFECIEVIFEKGVLLKGVECGVGLVLVKQQVEVFGGVIFVEFESGIFI